MVSIKTNSFHEKEQPPLKGMPSDNGFHWNKWLPVKEKASIKWKDF